MNGFEKRRAQKKQNIRIAALKLFSDFGFDKVTIKEIAKSAGVSPVSIYNFFGSKEDLIREVIKSLLDDMVSKIFSEIDKENITLKEKLEKILFIKKGFLNNKYWSLLIKAAESDVFIREYIQEVQSNSIEIFSDIIKKGQKEGLITKELSSSAIFIFLDMYRTYFMSNESTSIQIENDQTLLDELNTMFWKALS